jgi:flagellar hook protein FlgE
MIRSMSAAVTGLRGHQLKLDVIGNNIANVNTTAFKKSQARFEDLLSQTIQGATGPLDRGGINPSQVGLGMRVSTIVDMHLQGAITTTDRVTDLAIEGQGFFVVTDGTGQQFYTRDGSFGLDANGNMVNNNGFMLVGIDGNPINIPLGDDMIARATENIRFAGNLDSRLSPAYSLYLDQATLGTFDITVTIDGADIEIEDIDFGITATELRDLLEAEPEIGSVTVTGLGTASRPFVISFNQTIPADASVTLTITDNSTDGEVLTDPAGYIYEYYAYDSLGNRYSLEFAFTQTDLNNNTWDYSVKVFDENNNRVTPVNGANGSLAFNSSGQLDTSNVPPIEFGPAAGANPVSILANFDNLSQIAGSSSLVAREQDGFPAGALAAFNIGRTGIVNGTYTNGLVREFGQIGIAYFFNPEGLVREGGNLYRNTENSGDPEIAAPGAGGRGLIQSSALELSNTDLAYEFTELITTSRGFQANTRVVTTSDEVIVEVINMKR